MTSTQHAPTPDEAAALRLAPKDLLVGGEWRPAIGGRRFDVIDPSTEETLASVADATVADAHAALDRAVDTQAAWASTPPRERAEVLRRAFESMMSHSEGLATLMTLEMGKPLAESRSEVAYAAEFFRWFSEESCRVAGRWQESPDGRSRLLVLRQPVGPCLLVTPWNFPLAMGTRKLGPALAAGCTAIVKPAEQTPLSMLALGRLLQEAGVPDGVLSVLPTSEPAPLVEALLDDRRLRKLSFTGSTEVGRQLAAAASGRLKRVSMELGGNAPFVVFEDADLDLATDGAVIAKMRNVGEACTAANRFLVAEAVADAFAERLAARLASMRVGRGTEEDVEVGPLVDEPGRAKVARLVDDAVARGAEALTGAHPLGGRSFFYAPTVLDRVPAGSAILDEEVFGPVAPIVRFSSEDEAIALANATPFGLVAYAFTNDLSRSIRLIERLETGMVGLNQGLVSNPAAPFGGVKDSGFGREGGPEGIEEYLDVKYAAIRP